MEPLKETPVSGLKPLASPAHTRPRPQLRALSDEELLRSSRDPKNGDFITIDTRTGNVVDGNGRTHELQHRATDPASGISPETLIPIRQHVPDTSMFPDLPGGYP